MEHRRPYLRLDLIGRKVCPGFTLIELLTVVAVITLLSSLFLSTLARAKASARSVVCKSNLRQQGLGLAMYVGDFHKYPLSEDSRLQPETVWSGQQFVPLGAWAKVLRPYVTPNRKVGLGPRAFLCTESERMVITVAKSTVASRVVVAAGFYGYNGYGTGINYVDRNLGLGKAWVDDEMVSVQEVAESSVKAPSEMIAIGDSTGTASVISPVIQRSGFQDLQFYLPAKRHNLGANVTFCDGHVEHAKFKELVEVTPQARRRWNNDYEAHPETW